MESMAATSVFGFFVMVIVENLSDDNAGVVQPPAFSEDEIGRCLVECIEFTVVFSIQLQDYGQSVDSFGFFDHEFLLLCCFSLMGLL